MPVPFAISVTLYGDDDEPKQTYKQCFIPWKMMKEAMKFSKKAADFGDIDNIDDQTFDDIADFVVALFNNKFTRDELDNGMDAGEVITVISQVVAKVSGQNPT